MKGVRENEHQKLLLVFAVTCLVAGLAFAEKLVVWTWYGAELGQVFQELVKPTLPQNRY